MGNPKVRPIPPGLKDGPLAEERQETWDRAFGGMKEKETKETEMTAVQLPAVKLFRQVIQPKFPNAVLIVNPLSDTYFTSETVTSKNGKSISKNAIIMEKAKKQGFDGSQPDMLIICPMNGKSGLAMELKQANVKVFKKDGTLRKNDHLALQAEYLRKLHKSNFKVAFCCGLEEVVAQLNKYFNLKITI